jgi:hypothetical protein
VLIPQALDEVPLISYYALSKYVGVYNSIVRKVGMEFGNEGSKVILYERAMSRKGERQ